MAQFGGGKAPPPWQQRPQATPTPQLQPSLLGQHPSAPTQQLVLGGAPQQAQYAPVQQSIIQPPGLGGLQTLGQPTITQQTIGQPATGGSLMGQPPMTCQGLQPPSLINPAQMTNAQIQPQIQPQIQAQVTAVTYPTPRALAPPGAFNPPAAPTNIGNNLAGTIQANMQNNINSNNPAQQPQKQRVFTGTITKLCADFGFVDEDVFFQTTCVKGQAPKVCDRVLVEATYNPNMPFKWNANRVQVIPGPAGTPSVTQNRSGPPAREISTRGGSYNAVPPPNFSSVEAPVTNFGGRGGIGPRPRSPRRERREERGRTTRDSERERSEKDKEEKRESRKRSRSRGRSRSPPRRRMRVVPRYNVQVPKILLHMKEANVLELKKRYNNLYVPSDVFLARPLWSDTFPAHRAFQFPRPVSFHIMNKEVEPVLENDAIYDPPDVNHCYAAKVMLMAVPALEDIFRRSCALSEDHADVRECFVHPTRLINFLVGLKGKNETMAIGGYWSPSLDGANPEKDPNVLIHTAIRTCKALTGIDLAGCTTWYRFAEIYYRRGESTHKGRSSPARVETTVLFLPDVWNVCPTKLEWDGLHLNYKRQLDKKLSSSAGCQQQLEDLEGEEEDKEETARKNPSHYATLDPKTMKVVELRNELDARMLNSKGLKSQLIARLTKILKNEQEKEEMEKAAAAESAEGDENKRKEEEDRKREEERKRKEEEERKKEEEERKKAEERERNLLEKRYTLPDQPMIVVHPSRTAKSGKFDCTTMSLSVLLDYRQEDNKEHSFEVSLFAELFNEMLMRDFAFRIYKALVESPEKPAKEEKKEKEDKKEKDKDRREKDKKEDKDEKEKKEDKDKKEESEEKEEKVEEEKSSEKKDKKATEKEEEKKEEEDEEEEMEEDEEEEMDDEDSKDEMPTSKRGDSKEGKESKEGKRKDDKKDRERREKKEKKKMFTVDPYLLLSFVYFDQTHTGYIIDRDLEDIINMLGLNLSRAQQKKLMSKVMSRDVLHYRKLTDVPLEEKDKPRDSLPVIDLEVLAKGNNTVMPVFLDATSAPYAVVDIKSIARKSVRVKEEPLIAVHESSRIKDPVDSDTVSAGSQGVVKYGGSLVDIGKLIQQLEKSENARNSTEEKLRELQKDLMSSKEDARKSHEKCVKLSKEVKTSNSSLKTMEEELQKAIEDNNVYQKALNQIKTVIKPLVAGVDLDEEDIPLKVKSEPKENGTVG